MSILTDVLNVLSTKATHDMILPAIQTALHPYLLANADTTGPIIKSGIKKSQKFVFKLMCGIYPLNIPALKYTPDSKLPTQATLPLPSPKYST